MKVYVAGPYGRRKGLSETEIEANVAAAIKIARELIILGHNPMVPHLSHYIHKDWAWTPDENKWWDLCRQWIDDCDCVLFTPGWETSVGSQMERAYALGLGLPIVFYHAKELNATSRLADLANVTPRTH